MPARTLKLRLVVLVLFFSALAYKVSYNALAAPDGMRLPFVGHAQITQGPQCICRDCDHFGPSSEAIDFSTDSKIIRAPQDGNVILAVEQETGFGNHVIIGHRDGTQSLYGHLEVFFVFAGDKVKRGDIIGIEGSTGRSTGPHLHFEVHQGDDNASPVSIRDLPGITWRFPDRNPPCAEAGDDDGDANGPDVPPHVSVNGVWVTGSGGVTDDKSSFKPGETLGLMMRFQNPGSDTAFGAKLSQNIYGPSRALIDTLSDSIESDVMPGSIWTREMYHTIPSSVVPGSYIYSGESFYNSDRTYHGVFFDILPNFCPADTMARFSQDETLEECITPTPVLTTVPPTPQPPSDGIELCDGTNYGGPCKTHTYTSSSACINLADSGMDNRAESLRFRGNYGGAYEVILYGDNSCGEYNGRYGSDAPDLGGLNNQISSIQIQKIEPADCTTSSDGVTLYVNGEYAGHCHTFAPGTYNDLSQYGLDRNISSIYNPNSAFLVRLHDDLNEGGTPGQFDESVTELGIHGWADRARSVHIERHRPTACNPGSDGVIMYVDNDYRGGCLTVTSDIPDLTPLALDHALDSIRFVGSYQNTKQLLIYRQPNYQDLCGSYWQDQSDLRECAGQAVSVQVRDFTAPTPVPTDPGEQYIGNIAPLAYSDHTGSDAIVDGALSTEWVPGHKVPIAFVWPEPVDIHKVIVWDRTQNSPDNSQINLLRLDFSDGTYIDQIDMMSLGPRCAEITFPAKSVTWVNVVPYDASGANGYKEVEIWATTGQQFSNNTCVIEYSKMPVAGAVTPPLSTPTPIPTQTPTPTDVSGPTPTSTSTPTVTSTPTGTPIGLPQNGKIVFMSAEILYLSNPDGTSRVTLAGDNPNRGNYPKFSPNGSLIAFEGYNDGDTVRHLWTMRPDGTNTVQVSSLPINHGTIVWSPEGDRILFKSGDLYAQDAIAYIVNADGTGLSPIPGWPTYLWPSSWSPNGQRILAHDNTGHIWVLAPDGSNPVQLSPATVSGESQAQWSSDGSRIVFNSRGPDSANSVVDGDIWVMNADGSNRVRLTTTPGDDFDSIYPRWSPDGMKIVFSSNRNANTWHLWVMNADGSEQVNVDSTPGFGVQWSSWGPLTP